MKVNDFAIILSVVFSTLFVCIPRESAGRVLFDNRVLCSRANPTPAPDFLTQQVSKNMGDISEIFNFSYDVDLVPRVYLGTNCRPLLINDAVYFDRKITRHKKGETQALLDPLSNKIVIDKKYRNESDIIHESTHLLTYLSKYYRFLRKEMGCSEKESNIIEEGLAMYAETHLFIKRTKSTKERGYETFAKYRVEHLLIDYAKIFPDHTKRLSDLTQMPFSKKTADEMNILLKHYYSHPEGNFFFNSETSYAVGWHLINKWKINYPNAKLGDGTLEKMVCGKDKEE